ncbi:MAG: hypothetical protein A3C84_04120 [Candidatus Ryanbacteria bacterium RIFCSPHIGHO2_02_FULL_48_12]|uniref:Uncharacterized protein n=1 Tax=Candidatus Ryanbacteria bacterium RIFCSPHIGHO2_01_FULL_48_27 TaxID=1802115 RepID=A0A1G2G6Q1_9BACT|nr:MAG: hypothetical protein A2756_00835 [Candidatus Ryanbacteria bacterium RIFCSPHIGHO2_01_FULL_48_27]OGZ48552.1 MAG: hypothetical protein A3C84_04120 [Candidatus Ryanbacteria bacterium RIFCSPHIGHO2_02_FULL_48_12]
MSIITGDDPSVRETYGEVLKTLETCRKFGSKRHLAVGLAPHITRIRLLWRKAHPAYADPQVFFLPVEGPWEYWLWETAMLCLYLVAPPGSRAQKFLLDLGRRKG